MKTNRIRRALLGAGATIALTLGATWSATAADNWPSRPITLIAPVPAGDNSDSLARALADHLSKRLGQAVVVENKPGGGTLLGSNFVARAAPDGYTFMLTTSALTVMYHTRDDVKLNLSTDFEPVIVLAEPSLVLTTNPEVPAKNMTELIDWMKANPGKANFATYGVGSLFHLGAEMLSRQAGVEMNYVPYNGSAPALQDLIGGRIQLMFNSFRTIGPLAQEGKVNAIAATNQGRSTLYPDIPTVAEAALPDFSIATWYAMFAPKGTPAPIVEKMNALSREIMALPDMKQMTDTMDFRQIVSDLPATREIVDGEVNKWGEFVKETGIRVQQ